MSDYKQRSLHDSGAETVDGNSDDVNVREQSGPFSFVLDVTAQSGTTPTLDVDIEGKCPVSGKYVVLGSFTQVGDALSTQKVDISEIAFATIRAAWDLEGTTPSYTFTLSMSAKDRN